MSIKLRIKKGQLQVRSNAGWLNVNKSDRGIGRSACLRCSIMGPVCGDKGFDCSDIESVLMYKTYFTKPEKKKRGPSPEFLEALQKAEVGDEVEIAGATLESVRNGVFAVDSTTDTGVRVLNNARNRYAGICYQKINGRVVRGEEPEYGRIVAIRGKTKWIKR